MSIRVYGPVDELCDGNTMIVTGKVARLRRVLIKARRNSCVPGRGHHPSGLASEPLHSYMAVSVPNRLKGTYTTLQICFNSMLLDEDVA